KLLLTYHRFAEALEVARRAGSTKVGGYGLGGAGEGPGVIVSAEAVRPWYGFS
ncbi:MAG: hypothetical protein QOC99_1076, partial [Acidobacteriota bacterium]|nr:hypothetical protein [Acidobacteriota bacterium]